MNQPLKIEEQQQIADSAKSYFARRAASGTSISQMLKESKTSPIALNIRAEFSRENSELGRKEELENRPIIQRG